jgi:hypothetical protein
MRHGESGQGGNAPERALLAAIVLQAVTDLNDPDETVRFEAHEFFLQRRGGWADMRKFYFDALGFDERRVLASLGPRLSPPERPEVRLTYDVLYRELPRVPFTISDLIRKHRRGYSQLRGLIQTCEDKGIVVRTGHGAFCRADSLPPPPAPPKPKPKPDARRIILDTLLDGPKTIREINFALDGEIDNNAIREHLKRAVEECVVEYDVPFWSLRKIAA